MSGSYQEAIKRQYERELARLSDDLKWMLADARGRRILSWIVERGGLRAQTAPDAHHEFVSGRRSLAVEIVDTCSGISIEDVGRMHAEYYSDVTENKKVMHLALQNHGKDNTGDDNQ